MPAYFPRTRWNAGADQPFLVEVGEAYQEPETVTIELPY